MMHGMMVMTMPTSKKAMMRSHCMMAMVNDGNGDADECNDKESLNNKESLLFKTPAMAKADPNLLPTTKVKFDT